MTEQKKLPTCARLESERSHETHCAALSDGPTTVDLRLLPIREVQAIVGLSRASIYSLMKVGKFPACRKVCRTSRWINTEINEWIASLDKGVRA